jgi:hypothetical protein
VVAAEPPDDGGLAGVGGRLLEAGLVTRGAGDRPDGGSCACGQCLRCEGTRPKEIQTLLGWITVRRRYSRCTTCTISQVPLDQPRGLHRDSHSAGVRRLGSQCGVLLPFAQAASTLQEAAGIQLSTSTVRTVTEGLGAEREDAIVSEVAAAWEAGCTPVPGDVPTRWYVAMGGVRILSTDGQGREAKLEMVVPVLQTAEGERLRSAGSRQAR